MVLLGSSVFQPHFFFSRGNNKIKKHLGSNLIVAVIIMANLLIKPAFSAPASPEPQQVCQPNGLVFTVHLQGDEFGAWAETEDGYSVVQNPKTCVWEYAINNAEGRLVPAGVMFDPRYSAPSSIEPHIKPEVRQKSVVGKEYDLSQSESQLFTVGSGGIIWPTDWTPQPTTGTRKLLVILVEFSNCTLTTTPAAWYSRFFDTSTNALSLVNYYSDNSYGNLTVQPLSHTQTGCPAGVVKVRLSISHPNINSMENKTRATDLDWMNPALIAASQYVNFASLDTDGDGWIESNELNVYFIPAGYEHTSSTKTPCYPGHMWWSEGSYRATVQNKVLEKWAVCGELMTSGTTDYQHTVGVLVHELGHSMCGLPDLYDRDLVNKGLGRFSAMSHGCHGKDSPSSLAGQCPVSMDSWSRQYAGWNAPGLYSDTEYTFITRAQESEYFGAVKMSIPNHPSEYFIAEVRGTDIGWDRGIRYYPTADNFDWNNPDGTPKNDSLMVIMHVDESVGDPYHFDINDYTNYNGTSRSFQGVVVEEDNTSYSDPYYSGTSSMTDITKPLSIGKFYHLFWDNDGTNTWFNDYSTPNSRLHDGTLSKIGIYDISCYHDLTYCTIVPSGHLEIPKLTPGGGGFGTSSVSISMNTWLTGDTIKYTTDGSDPLNSSSAIAYGTSPITLPLTAALTTVNSRSFKSGYVTSPMRSEAYTRNYAPTIASISPATSTVNNSAWFTYSCRYNDANGASNIFTAMFTAKIPSGGNTTAIFMCYNNGYGTDFLYYWSAATSSWQGGIIVGTNTLLETADAYLDCGNTTVTTNGNNKTVNWKIKFKPSMAGQTYSLGHKVTDFYGANTGSSWVYMGTTTIL